jgi:hypothetical protein
MLRRDSHESTGGSTIVDAEKIRFEPAAADTVRVSEAGYPNEVSRWILVFGTPMLAACLCIGLAFGTRFAWFYGGAIAFGPGLGVLAIIYLAISSDTNGNVGHSAVGEVGRHGEPLPVSAAA